MIWYFLMGMLGGAVGMILLAKWWVEKHVRFYEMEENEKDGNE